MSPPADLDGLSPAELKALVIALFAKVAELERTVAGLRDENARLKGLSRRPAFKPSGMETGSTPKPARGRGKRRGGGKKTAQRVVHEDRVIKMPVPAGSRFKGYEDFVVQDLVLRAHVVRYRRERWQTADGTTITAPMPAGINGHFGPELRRFVLAQYHECQVTVRRLAVQLRAVGIDVSRRQVMRLLIAGQDGFVTEAREVLRAGLANAAWVSVDDTGARHQAANGTCTQIGNDHFAWFGTTGSRSRLNFLELLRAGYTDYVINDAALAYVRDHALAASVIARLAGHGKRQFADAIAWQRHLKRLRITTLQVTPDQVCIATEGALWGSIKAHGFLPETVIVSDDAGQFDVGRHALCWVHAERLVHKLDTFTELHRTAQSLIRELIWWFYSDLTHLIHRGCSIGLPERQARLPDAAFRRDFRMDYVGAWGYRDRAAWGTCPVGHGAAGWNQRAMPTNSSASGQQEANEIRTRDAVSVMRAAILIRRSRRVVNSALASGCGWGMASRTASISQ